MDYGTMTFEDGRTPIRRAAKVNTAQSQQKDVNDFLAWCSDTGNRPGRGKVLNEFYRLAKGGKDNGTCR